LPHLVNRFAGILKRKPSGLSSRLGGQNAIHTIRDFGLPRRCRWDLLSSGLLRSV